MITAVDTSILLDIFLPDPVHGEHSLNALEAAYGQGALVVCGVVYAELRKANLGFIETPGAIRPPGKTTPGRSRATE